MKRIFTFLFVLCAVVSSWADATLPQFSTAEQPVWYMAQFKAGGAFITSEGPGKAAKTGVSSFTDNQIWQLIGTQDNFVMKNKAGDYIGWGGSNFNTAAEGVALRLKKSVNAPGYWIIMRVGSEKGMNQSGGGGAGRTLSEWDWDDVNNPVLFCNPDDLNAQLDKVLPPFSDTANPHWLRLKFKSGGCYITDQGEGKNLKTKGISKAEGQQWQFIGNKDNFQLRNKAGRYMNFKGSNFTADVTGIDMQLIADLGSGALQLQRKANTGQAMNQNGGGGVDKDLAEYDINDGGNLFFAEDVAELKNLPVFSTEADPEWYNFQFRTGGAFLQDMGSGQKVKTAEKQQGNSQRWQFIGEDEYNFIMKSKAGNYLIYKDNRFQASNKKADAAHLNFVQNNDGASLELHLVGQGQAMNQVGGAGKDKELGLYHANDVNNPFSLLYAGAVYPAFSKGTYNRWFYIQFGNEGRVLCDKGLGNSIVTGAMGQLDDSQLWKFEGTLDKFQIRNKKGQYAVIEGEGNAARLKLGEQPFAAGFKMVKSKNATHEFGFEIIANGVAGDNICLNQWDVMKEGQEIGLWKLGNDNNTLYFVDEAENLPDDYKVEGASAFAPAHSLTLWYNEPATVTGVENKWMEYSLPIGNGQLGASLFGGVLQDEIQFNEKTLWTGSPKEYGHYKNFGSVFVRNLNKDFGLSAENAVADYVRFLDIEQGVAGVNYSNKAAEPTAYERRYLSSFPDKVIAARYVAKGAEKLNLRFTAVPGNDIKPSPVVYEGTTGTFTGKLETISYIAHFKVVPVGEKAEVIANEGGVTVKNADEVLLVLSGATDYDAYQKSYVSGTETLNADLKQRVDAAANKGWTAILKDHVADFEQWMGRVSFQLDGAKSTVTTKQLVDNYNNPAINSNGKGAEALFLEQLYFAYGRYLMISSSRGVDLPSNLQGIWNNQSYGPWHVDIHANINVQMNYWPAEPTNLSDLHLPFLNYIINMSKSDQWIKNAQNAGQKEGWTCYTENNIFGGGGGFMKNYVIVNAWYCTHLWQHYRYTLDKEFLKKAFPAMWTASRFWITRLVKAKDGSYECPKEYSPEQGPGAEDGVAHAQQLVWDLLANTFEAVKVLEGELPAEVTPELIAEHKDRLRHLDKGLATETYKGNWGNLIPNGAQLLREWKYSNYDVQGTESRHRHMSHLMCLYPFNQVTAESEFFKPAVNSLTLRGDAATGWSMGWKVNLWARALDGNHAHTIMHNALRHSTAYGTDQSRGGIYYNLYDSHAPFQIDGNFGVCSGVAEMLLQSQNNTVQILPALPEVWQKGSVKGLKAVGDFTVSIDWDKMAPTSVEIISNQGQPLTVSYKGIADRKVYVNGVEVAAKKVNENTISLTTEPKDIVTIDFTAIATGIDGAAVENAAGAQVIYNLAGVRMNGELNQLPKGVYVVNGQKVVVK